MKKILSAIIIMMLAGNMAYAQSTLFKKYENDKRVSTVYISKALLSLMPKMKLVDKDISMIAGELDHVQILTCDHSSLIPGIKSAALSCFKSEGYETLMTVNDKGEKTIIYAKKLPKGKKEFVLFSQEENELSIINVAGDISLNDIKQIAD